MLRGRPTADILWVIDNSRSMEDEQALVAEGFVSFIQNVEESNADFHIGVVTTDLVNTEQNGRLVGDPLLISSQMSIDDARDAFRALVRQLLTEPPARIAGWRQKILDALVDQRAFEGAEGADLAGPADLS